MSNTFNLPIQTASKILVEAGDSITNKTLLAKSSPSLLVETIHLAKLLGISNNKISKYLQKHIGEKVHAGDILASKKGLFSSSVVRSPIDGKLVGSDLARGIICISKKDEDENESLYSPVSGKVISISKSFIEIESDNLILKSEKAQGPQVQGELRLLQEENVGILQSFDDLENSIVLCRDASEAVLVKFSVIGVLGIIMISIPKEEDLTWMQINESTFEKLMKFDGQKIWLRPSEKQIIIIDE